MARSAWREAVERLGAVSKSDAPAVLADMLDHLDVAGRYALLKLATGALRVGISARLAKQALADAFGIDVEAVEEVWHGLKPPFAELFDWGEGRAEQPTAKDIPVFRPFMLAHPLDDTKVSLEEYAAEWKWDGIRIQLVHAGGDTRLYSAAPGTISAAAFPTSRRRSRRGRCSTANCWCAGQGRARAGRRRASTRSSSGSGARTCRAKVQDEYPAFVRLYDILFDGEEDVRALPWDERRMRLETVVARLDPERFDLSQLIEADSFEALEEVRAGVARRRHRGDDAQAPRFALCRGAKGRAVVQMETRPADRRLRDDVCPARLGQTVELLQRFHLWGWSESGELLPVGKAYFGFTDAELKMLDKFVRNHTLNRFGPVREVEKSLVLEVAFDSIHASKRHKSGLAMRFPRISRIRTDKPASEADTVAALLALAT